MSSVKQFWALFRTLLNLNFGFSYGRYTYIVQKKRLWEPIMIAVALASSGVTMMAGYIALLNAIYVNGQTLGQGNMILTLVIVAGQITVLILGLFWVIGAFYFSRETPTLVPLPILPGTVVLAKFAVLMVNEYITLALLLIPAFAVYAARSGAGLLYWITALAVFLLAPVIPLAISSIAAMVIMKFVNVRKSQTLFMVIGSVIFFGAYFWFQYAMMHMQPRSAAEMMNYLMTVQDSLSRTIAVRFPPSLWASVALSRPGTVQGIGSLLLFAAVSAAGVAAVLVVGSRMFYSGLLAGAEVAAGGNRRGRDRSRRGAEARAKGAGEGARGAFGGEERPSESLWASRSAVAAIAHRDLRIFLRTPAYAMNGFVNALIFPGLLLVWFVIGGDANRDPQLVALMNMLTSPQTASYRALVYAAMIMWTAGLHMVSSTAFSRDGKDYWINKAIPVSAEKLIRGKLAFALGFDLFAAVPLAVILQLIVKLPPKSLLMASAIALAGTLWITFVSLHVDMVRPYLKWDNPQRAMKSNLNGIIVWLLVSVVLAGLGFVVYRGARAGWSTWVMLWSALGIFTVLAGVSFTMLMRAAPGAIRSTEV